MLDIGARIKELREEREITGKDLARRIGLSPSQMTRLEKGQRRVDSEVIIKLAEALDLSPAAFFETGDGEPRELSPKEAKDAGLATLHTEIGKLIRSERRQRHITVDDLARRTGHSRAYVLAVEQGRRSGLDGDFLPKSCKILGLDPFRVLELQDRIIRTLAVALHRRHLAVTGAVKGAGADPDTPPDPNAEEIPILLGDEAPYPRDFGPDGFPVAMVEDTVRIPELLGRKAFALRVHDPAMVGERFHEGDLVVFDGLREARSGECAFVRFRGRQSTFCQFFRDDGESVRLQYLRPEHAPEILPVGEFVRAWPLAAHLVVGAR